MKKELSLVSSISTGGAGIDFERRVQAFFIIQMVNGGFVPTLPACSISKIICQGKNHGFNTDDCIVFTRDEGDIEHKLLIQCKLSITISNNKEFNKVMRDAWLDFSQNNLFDSKRDEIALITGSLSKTDDSFLEMLRDIHKEPSSEFFWEKYDGNGFSKMAKSKMGIVITSIKQANNNNMPTKKELFDFFEIFHFLKSDLHEDRIDLGGINLSLLQTELNHQLFSYEKSPQDIWNGIRTYLSDYNRHAIPILRTNLPNDLRNLFVQTQPIYQTQNFTARSILDEKLTDEGIISTSNKKVLVLMNLLGSFDQKNKDDIKIVEDFLGNDLDVLQDLLEEGNLSLTDGIWKIKRDRKIIFEQLGEKIFDQDIDKFKGVFSQVLDENNSNQDLNSLKKQTLITDFNKNFKYSKVLRAGVTEGMALVANNEGLFSNCSYQKVENVAFLSVQDLLDDYSNSSLWASIHEVLTPLAEISPKKFLDIVKKTFSIKNNNPFKELLNICNSKVFFSKDYLWGIRWALADLAWDKDYFGESALLLAKLADIEKNFDDDSHNYSLTILIEILLPWHPQTTAESMNRIAVVKSILKESSVVGWKLLKALLPNKTTSSTNHPTPSWLNTIPENMLESRVSNQEYWEQVKQYSKLFVDNAKELPGIIDVIKNVSNLPKSSFNLFVKNLNSSTVRGKLSESDEEVIWNALLDEVHHNERQMKSDINYALPMESVNMINALVEKFAPNDILEKYKRLFDNNDFKLYEDIDNWKESEKKLEIQRIDAVKNILETFEFKEIINFAAEVKFPFQVGIALGKIEEIDNEIFPKYIDKVSSHKELVRGYIVSRFYRTNPFDMNENMKWVKNIDFTNWHAEQIAEFLINLPFKQPIWNIVERQSKTVQNNYWQKVIDFRDMSDQGYLDYPFNKLLEVKRSIAAVDCFRWVLYHYRSKKISISNNEEINVNMCQKILLNLLELKDSDNQVTQELYNNITEIIDFLQQKLPLTDSNLWTIEWNFMPFFDVYNKKIPRAVIYSIENNPEIFHQMISTVFKSTNSLDTHTEMKVPELVTHNIYSLTIINDFKILPGTDENGKFIVQNFNSWIKKVKKLCESSGHWDAAQSTIGSYLINAPKDKTGLFIHKSVAKVLDQYDNEKMRHGYNTGIINNLGVQNVDLTGETNHKRFNVWNKRASEVEKAEFINLASTLRDLANKFEIDAKRDVVEAKKNENGIFD